MKNKKRGLTMIELLIVIAILALLMLVLLWSLRGQTYKARDARRKADIDTYEKVFEDYFNDKESYPDLGSIENCNSADLSPYIKRILCDPGPASDPYFYWVSDSGTAYAVCADLENEHDPDIEAVGCSNGCGAGGDYNYCVVVGDGIDVVGGDFDVGGGDVGAGPNVGDYACFAGGSGSVCNDYDAGSWNCEYTFFTDNCDGLCPTELYSTCVHW